MSKVKEIWEIIKRKDFKDGDEVHAVKFNGGILISDTLMKSIEPKLEELPKGKPSLLGELYGVEIKSTPYLPYIYREVKKHGKLVQSTNKRKG